MNEHLVGDKKGKTRKNFAVTAWDISVKKRCVKHVNEETNKTSTVGE